MYLTILPTQQGTTALLFAAWKGNSEVVKLLLQAGAQDIPNKVHVFQIKCISNKAEVITMQRTCIS